MQGAVLVSATFKRYGRSFMATAIFGPRPLRFYVFAAGYLLPTSPFIGVCLDRGDEGRRATLRRRRLRLP